MGSFLDELMRSLGRAVAGLIIGLVFLVILFVVCTQVV